MPSRYLRDGIIDSRRIGKLSEGAALLYYKLLSLVDDYGRYSADPELLIIRAFPWAQSRYTPEEIIKRLRECNGEAEPLLILYVVDGKPYLELQDKNRKPLASKSKFPSPTESDGSQEFPEDPYGCQGAFPVSNTDTNSIVVLSEKLAPSVKPGPVAITWKAELGELIDSASEEIHRAHPKARRDVGARPVAGFIMAILRDKSLYAASKLVEAKTYVTELVARHGRFCGSRQWVKDGGEYAKSITNWFAVTKYRYDQEPPEDDNTQLDFGTMPSAPPEPRGLTAQEIRDLG